MSQRVRLARRLAFGEADPAGTIYAPRAIDFGIQAVEQAWREAGMAPFRALIAERRLATPWVKAEATFARPLFAGDPFTLELWLAEIGSSSMRWVGEARDEAGQLLFSLDMVAVAVDLDSRRSVDVPPDIRAALTRFLAG
jgi:4-hydroxybenzoyl-CoA thioesterase